MSSQRMRVAIVGAGITGLTAAFKLTAMGRKENLEFDCVVFESRDRSGGAIWTELDDNRVIEHGPDSMLSSKPEAVELIGELGISDQLISTNESNRRSLVAFQGRLHALPEGFVMLAPSRVLPFIQSPLFSIAGKLRMALDLVAPPKSGSDDETVEEFVLRRFGKEALERVVQPMVGGIYVGDVTKLSARSTLPQFVAMETKVGSVIRGLWQRESRQEERTVSGARYSMFVSLAGGVGTLIQALESSLGADRVRTSTPVKSVERLSGGRFKVDSSMGVEEFDAVIFATPAHVTARLIGASDELIASQLSEIEAASAAVVNLLYRRNDIKHPLDGFGFVVPETEKRSLLAASFISNKFTNRGPEHCVAVRAFVGGVLHPEVIESSDEGIVDLVCSDLSHYLGTSAPPMEARVARFPGSMPQYNVGHAARVEKLMARASDFLPGIYLAGNSYHGVGIPDCVASATRAANALIEYARRRSRVESVSS